MRNVCKPDLYQLIKMNRAVHRIYKIDSILTELNKTELNKVLRLPPYHPELFPIELILETAKNLVAVQNISLSWMMFNI
jgi:transposase